MSITPLQNAESTGPGRAARLPVLLLSLCPALAMVFVLFGGGLLLGLLQALGDLPGQDVRFSYEHFLRVLSDPGFMGSLGLTLYISAVSTLISAVAATALALAITRWAGENRVIHFLLQVPLTVPHLVIAISVLLLLAPSGLVSRLFTASGLLAGASSFPLLVNDTFSIGIMAVYVWKEIPFITFMLLSVLKNFGPELMEVAATLKASPWQRFRHVTLPILWPSLGGACLIVFSFTFGSFEVPFLLGRSFPLTMPVWAYKNYSDVDLLARPEGIALSLIIAGIVIVAITLSHLLTQYNRSRTLL